MSKFRAWKQQLEKLLMPPAWPEDAPAVPQEAENVRGMEAVSPLLAMLPRGGLLKWRAVIILGRVVPDLATKDMDAARNIMRRCMWHLNEDSGNMGWGVAEAMGEILAYNDRLATEFGKVALSYVRDTGFADNFIDYPELRRGAYWAAGRFGPAYSAFWKESAELLSRGLGDEDGQCRGIAAWGLGNLALAGRAFDHEEKERLAALVRPVLGIEDVCEILIGRHLCHRPASVFARQAMSRIMELRK